MDNVETGVIIFFIIMFAFIIFIALICWIIRVVGQWKMFKKAGKDGWPAIIPIYNTYVLCQITGVSPWWIVIVIAANIIGNLIPGIGQLLIMAASIYFGILLAVSTANSYGKDIGWAVGLFFLQPFFSLALGIGKSEYVGPKPMEDPVMGLFIKEEDKKPTAEKPVPEAEVKSETTEDKANNTCPGCGKKMKKDSKFCPYCGKEL